MAKESSPEAGESKFLWVLIFRLGLPKIFIWNNMLQLTLLSKYAPYFLVHVTGNPSPYKLLHDTRVLHRTHH